MNPQLVEWDIKLFDKDNNELDLLELFLSQITIITNETDIKMELKYHFRDINRIILSDKIKIMQIYNLKNKDFNFGLVEVSLVDAQVYQYDKSYTFFINKKPKQLQQLETKKGV